MNHCITHWLVPAAATASYIAVGNPAQTEDTSAEKVKKSKLIDAKKVAKDMERWAKKAKSAVSKKAPANGAGFVSIESAGDCSSAQSEVATPTVVQPIETMSEARTSLAGLGEDELPTPAARLLQCSVPGVDEWEAAVARGHVDVTQFQCLLCQRAFGSDTKLQKHVRVSELHKQNVETERKTVMASLSETELDTFERLLREASYRDRAAERKAMFGAPAVPQPPHSKHRKKAAAAATRPVEPNKHGIGSDNVGNKLLKQMGWSEGTGLGREGQGITTPIQAEMRTAGTGIGAGVVLTAEDGTLGDNYANSAKATARARYRQLNN